MRPAAALGALVWGVFWALGCAAPGAPGPSVDANTDSAWLAQEFQKASAGIRVPTSAPEAPADGTGRVTIDPSSPRQTIEGFGGSNAWTGLPSDPTTRAAVVKKLFSPTEGAGLTLIRNRIPFRESTVYNDDFVAKAAGRYTFTQAGGHKTFTLNWGNWDLANTRTLFAAASAYSSEIRGFSSAWTPPNNSLDRWKFSGFNAEVEDAQGQATMAGNLTTNVVGGTNGTEATWPDIGGVLAAAHYQDYADVLADYAKGFEANMGYPLAALSVQNEPNYLPKSYESCWWDGDQFHAFWPSLASAWRAKGVVTPVVAPESFSFTEALAVATLNDPATAGLVPIAAVHQYNLTYNTSSSAPASAFGAAWLPHVKGAGKRLWVTEVSRGWGLGADIADGLYWARLIHQDLTAAEVNAFCYWWLWSNGSTSESGSLLTVNGTSLIETKRLSALGQFSRFVRPGWTRLLATTAPRTNVETSVFLAPDGASTAVVLINRGASAQTVEIAAPSGQTLTGAHLWRTSASESLASAGTPADGAIVSLTLPAQSVSTLTATLSGAPAAP